MHFWVKFKFKKRKTNFHYLSMMAVLNMHRNQYILFIGIGVLHWIVYYIEYIYDMWSVIDFYAIVATNCKRSKNLHIVN